VVGVRCGGDLEVTGASDTFAPWKFSDPWFGTVRGRAGYANILFCGNGGLAFGELRGETFGLAHQGWMDVGRRRRIRRRTGPPRSNISLSISPRAPFAITGVSNGNSFVVVRAGVSYHLY
jgi:outer membrane immunogenic protein